MNAEDFLKTIDKPENFFIYNPWDYDTPIPDTTMCINTAKYEEELIDQNNSIYIEHYIVNKTTMRINWILSIRDYEVSELAPFSGYANHINVDIQKCLKYLANKYSLYEEVSFDIFIKEKGGQGIHKKFTIEPPIDKNSTEIITLNIPIRIKDNLDKAAKEFNLSLEEYILKTLELN